MKHFDEEFQRDELIRVRRMERSNWLEKQLTDNQRMDRAKLEAKMRNGKLRRIPTVFGEFETP